MSDIRYLKIGGFQEKICSLFVWRLLDFWNNHIKMERFDSFLRLITDAFFCSWRKLIHLFALRRIFFLTAKELFRNFLRTVARRSNATIVFDTFSAQFKPQCSTFEFTILMLPVFFWQTFLDTLDKLHEISYYVRHKFY